MPNVKFRDDLKELARDINLIERDKTNRYPRIYLNKNNDYLYQSIEKYFTEYSLNTDMYREMIEYGYNLKRFAESQFKRALSDLRQDMFGGITLYISWLKSDIKKYVFGSWFKEILSISKIDESKKIVIIKCNTSVKTMSTTYQVNLEDCYITATSTQSNSTKFIREEILLKLAKSALEQPNQEIKKHPQDIPQHKAKQLAVMAKKQDLNISNIVSITNRLDYFKKLDKLFNWYVFLVQACRSDGLTDDCIRVILPNTSFLSFLSVTY